VAIETRVKCPGGPTRMTGTDITYHDQVPSTGKLQQWHSPETPSLRALGSSLVPPPAAADARGQHSTLHAILYSTTQGRALHFIFYHARCILYSITHAVTYDIK
jgi:hypothetical protein